MTYIYPIGDPPWDQFCPVAPWTPLIPNQPWGQRPQPSVVKTTITIPQESARDKEKEERLIKTILYLVDVIVDEQFEIYTPLSAESWEDKQRTRRELIADTFLYDGDLDL